MSFKKNRSLIVCDSVKILLLDILPMFLSLCDSPEVKTPNRFVISNIYNISASTILLNFRPLLIKAFSITLSLRAWARPI